MHDRRSHLKIATDRAQDTREIWKCGGTFEQTYSWDKLDRLVGVTSQVKLSTLKAGTYNTSTYTTTVVTTH